MNGNTVHRPIGYSVMRNGDKTITFSYNGRSSLITHSKSQCNVNNATVIEIEVDDH